ncbi:MAG TPA: Gfo/Idh/MocA family oxidoreductase [Acidisarcina sp.]
MAFTRREFTRLLAGTAAACSIPHLAASRALAQTSTVTETAGGKRVGYCVVGLGRISADHFMPGVRASARSRVTALVSGHPDKARKLAAQYGLPDSSVYTYETYDRIRDNPEVDAVYIGLPNSMHAEYSIRAAEAGKHVLCEKPMSTSVADAREMIAASAKAGKKLMIAYRVQLEPTNLRAIELIRSGALGSVQAIESANGFNISKGEWRLNKKLAGGGPLLDVGIYSLNATRYLTGEEPQHISAYSSVIDHDGRFDEVEENISWTMKFPSGIVASCNSTYGGDMDGYYRVHGSKGVLQLLPAFIYEGEHLTGHLYEGDQHLDEAAKEKDPAHFTRMADHFSTCVIEGKTPRSPGEEGLRDMSWIAEIYKSAGLSL